MLRNSRASTADCVPNKEADFAAKSPRARLFDELWQGNLDVPSEQAMDDNVED